jgi:leucyl aminopeptidase
LQRGRVLALRTNDARALANEPGNVLSPRVFAERVVAMATAAGLGVEVLEPEAMERLGMGLLLGVGQGSAEPARLVTLTYHPPSNGEGRVLGFVGKGVTFDTGGISIKPADGMDRMKTDMSGGAAVAAALCAIAELRPAVKVVGVIPIVENMPGGRAIRPGDVLQAASGKTVEVNNTDAEGRLILGDALWYAQQKGATHLVDVATLTGACVVALGKFMSGLFASDDDWRDEVRAAGNRAGERLWPMPLDAEFGELLKSDIADIVNTGGRAAGAVTAAWFLKEFAGGRPWAHLDIAGTAWTDDAKPYQPKGPTGVAVRTLAELALAAGSGRSRSRWHTPVSATGPA